MFNLTVAAKCSTHAKIKYTQLQLIDLLSLGLMFVKKITSFCQVLIRCTRKKIGSFFLLHGVEDGQRCAGTGNRQSDAVRMYAELISGDNRSCLAACVIDRSRAVLRPPRQ